MKSIHIILFINIFLPVIHNETFDTVIDYKFITQISHLQRIHLSAPCSFSTNNGFRMSKMLLNTGTFSETLFVFYSSSCSVFYIIISATTYDWIRVTCWLKAVVSTRTHQLYDFVFQSEIPVKYSTVKCLHYWKFSIKNDLKKKNTKKRGLFNELDIDRYFC